MNSLRTIRIVSRGYRHAKRYQQIVSVLFKNGFGFLFTDLNPQWLSKVNFWKKAKHPASLQDAVVARRIRSTLIELGPTFVKFGQMLSCRPDLLPEEIINALSGLQSQVPPEPFDIIHKTLESEFGRPLTEIFESFPETSSGAASIAQGYRAILKDGREVFVKVQRPGILPKIEADLDILGVLADYLEKSIPELETIRPSKLVADFSLSLLEELDFLHEAANMRAFRRQFEHEPSIVIPEPVTGLCSRRVLTMTCIQGVTASNRHELVKAGLDPHDLAVLGVRLLLEQIFTHGFFHGDPHPGNMFFLPGPKIAYVDFGTMGRLTIAERELLKKITAAMFLRDMREMSRYAIQLSDAPEQVNQEELERELGTLVDAHLQGSLQELNLVQLSLDFQKLCYRQHLCLKPHFFRMIRALGYADAMGRQLVPEFRVFDTLKPFMKDQAIQRTNPAAHLKKAIRSLGEWSDLVCQFPQNAQQLLQQLKSGTLTLRHQQDDLRYLADHLDGSARHLARTLLLATLLVISSLLLIFKIPPLCYGISIIGGCILIISLLATFIQLFKHP